MRHCDNATPLSNTKVKNLLMTKQTHWSRSRGIKEDRRIMQDGKLAEVLTWLVVSSSLHYRRVVHRLSCPYTANDVVFSVIPRH